MKDVFTKIYETNERNNDESVSGSGSTLAQTKRIVQELPKLLKKFGITSMLDIACGDFNWMKTVDLQGVKYIGADIVDKLIAKNKELYESTEFMVLDVVEDQLPQVDLVMCRDCLVHLSYEDIYKALRNMCNSGAKFVLITTFPMHCKPIIIPTGSWRVVNFQGEPFNFPDPSELLNEGCSEAHGQYIDKGLGLWKVEDIKDLVFKEMDDNNL
jgi:SAM-dependent methyltransferase